MRLTITSSTHPVSFVCVSSTVFAYSHLKVYVPATSSLVNVCHPPPCPSMGSSGVSFIKKFNLLPAMESTLQRNSITPSASRVTVLFMEVDSPTSILPALAANPISPKLVVFCICQSASPVVVYSAGRLRNVSGGYSENVSCIYKSPIFTSSTQAVSSPITSASVVFEYSHLKVWVPAPKVLVWTRCQRPSFPVMLSISTNAPPSVFM